MKGYFEFDSNLIQTIPNGQYNSRLRDIRMGIMLHYDGSGSDRGSLQWFSDSRCKVSYNIIVLDDGNFVQIAPDNTRAWHAGRCATSDRERLPYKDANSAFYGVAIANSGRESITSRQLFTVVAICYKYYEQHKWPLEDSWRIVGHKSEAVNRDGTRGRKSDPEGLDPKNPIMSTMQVRELLSEIVIP